MCAVPDDRAAAQVEVLGDPRAADHLERATRRGGAAGAADHVSITANEQALTDTSARVDDEGSGLSVRCVVGPGIRVRGR